MTTHNKTTHTLNDLIAISRDGRDFYQEAAEKVSDAQLSALFLRIAGVKSDIVSSLGTIVASLGGNPDQHGTVVGSMQQFYGKLRATLGDKDYAYVAELEESEDRLLKAFDATIADPNTPATARDAALRLLPDVRACHDVMRNRKHAMKRAA